MQSTIGSNISNQELDKLKIDHPYIICTLFKQIFYFLESLSKIEIKVKNDEVVYLNLYENVLKKFIQIEKMKNNGIIPLWLVSV